MSGITEKTHMDKRDFDDLVNRLNSPTFKDKDRIRLLKTAVENHLFTSEEAAKIVAVHQFADAKAEACTTIFPSITDKNNFDAKVITLLKYEDEKQKVRKALNL
eukprot:GEZU01029656.1.p1 GENE.GEZU01029656.1~~GEZU01029656.1.p1  ORF type:complete len:104 (+),score=22.44 GEZU01029656.1:43-354(+)